MNAINLSRKKQPLVNYFQIRVAFIVEYFNFG